MRYGNQTIVYDDTEDTPALHDTASLENTPPTHSILEQYGETIAKYCKDPNHQIDLAELQEIFQQLLEWLTYLEPTANPPACIEELAHLTNKPQQLALTLQQCPPTFDGLHTTKLEDWLSDIKMAADNLEESQAHLAKFKWCSLAWTFMRHSKLGSAGMTLGIYFI